MCHGIGSVKSLDENKIIDYNVPLRLNPIRCWNRYKDFYIAVLEAYCRDKHINPDKTFRELSEDERAAILRGSSVEKYSVRYKKLNFVSRRTTKYYGVMTEQPMLPSYSIGSSFYSDFTCGACGGRKYSSEHENYKIFGYSIGKLMTLPFSTLSLVLSKIAAQLDSSPKLVFSLKKLIDFVRSAESLQLGHLHLHRTIPSLSGGELQRLRLVQVFNSQLSDLLVILDEPLAGLSGRERKAVYDNIVKISNKHTLLIVDHSKEFAFTASRIYALGEGSGINGGNLIDVDAYWKSQKVVNDLIPPAPQSFFDICLNSRIYDFCGVDLTIALNCLNLITGASGVGKSTLLREYFPQVLNSYVYVSQKVLVGNKNSCVATLLDIYGQISQLFAKKHNKDKKLFSNLTGNDGACPMCGGAGYIEYGYDARTKVCMQCESCNGTGFNPLLKKYKLEGKSIFDVWAMTIDEGESFFRNFDAKLAEALQSAVDLLLGHLKIGQPTNTLSGGENIRAKLLKSRRSSAKIIGVDEPFKGLNRVEIFTVAKYLDYLRQKGKTVCVIDHSSDVECFFSKKIHLVNLNGRITGMNMEESIKM